MMQFIMAARRISLFALLLGCSAPSTGGPAEGALPESYFRMMEAEMAPLETALEDPTAAEKLNAGQLSAALLSEAVLHAKPHPANPSRGNPKKLAHALRFGDLLAEASRKGLFTKDLNHQWNLHFWLDAFRLLDRELGDERRQRWRGELEKILPAVAEDVIHLADRPRYQAPFIITSTNHLSLRASGIHLAGRVLKKPEWELLGARVLHRLAAEEQTPDGYWGEHSDAGPETGYNYLSFTGMALYWEHSRDPAALEALRRGTDFHTHFTYPDGVPVETINGRNRHWGISPWGHFGFSHFPDGRRYAEFLSGFLRRSRLGAQGLGRIAQNALYFHEGPLAPIPQDQATSSYRMKVPAGIRRKEPWTICLSGLLETPADANRFFLDRQGHLSIFHETQGLIVTGANSKRQPELATFTEKVGGQVRHLPMSSRLRLDESGDRLSLAYNLFWADLAVAPPSEKAVSFRFSIMETGRSKDVTLTLQLRLKPGDALETANSRAVVGSDRIDQPDVGGWIRHRGWTLKVDHPAKLVWPVYPFNPYAEGPETKLDYAVATLSLPVPMESRPEWAGGRRGEAISFALEIDGGK